MELKFAYKKKAERGEIGISFDQFIGEKKVFFVTPNS